MRRNRSLTPSERWELGLFLTMMIVACLCVTVLLNLNSIPRLFAVFSTSNADAPVMAPSLPNVIENASPQLAPIGSYPLNVNPQTFPFGNSIVNNLLPGEPSGPTVDIPEAPKSRLAPAHSGPEIRTFNGRKYRLAKIMRLRVTAYAPDIRCTWPYPGTTTASGMSVKTNRGRLVAADTQLIPMHALVAVPGYAQGNPVPVLDRGGAIKGRRLDLLMPTFGQAKDWGSKSLEVKVYLPLSEE